MALFNLVDNVLEKAGFSFPGYGIKPTTKTYTIRTFRHIGADRFYTIYVDKGNIDLIIYGEFDSKELYDKGKRYKITLSWDSGIYWLGGDGQEIAYDLDEAIKKGME